MTRRNDRSTSFHGRADGPGCARAPTTQQAREGPQEGGQGQTSSSQEPPQSVRQRDSGGQQPVEILSHNDSDGNNDSDTTRTTNETDGCLPGLSLGMMERLAVEGRRQAKLLERKQQLEASKKKFEAKVEADKRRKAEHGRLARIREEEKLQKRVDVSRTRAEARKKKQQQQLLRLQKRMQEKLYKEEQAEEIKFKKLEDMRVKQEKAKIAKREAWARKRLAQNIVQTYEKPLFRGRPGTLNHEKLHNLEQHRNRARRPPPFDPDEEAEIYKSVRRYITPNIKQPGGYVTLTPTVLERATQLLTNQNLRQVVASPRRVIDKAGEIVSRSYNNTNFFINRLHEKRMDEDMADWLTLKRQAEKPGPFTPNVYSCVNGQYSYDDPPSKWVPYAADDFFADLQEKSPRYFEEDGSMARVYETPPFPEPGPADALPQNQLLEQLHRYVSGYAHRNYPLLMGRMDESALLGMGVVVEEKIKSMLGKNGDLFYAVKEGTDKV
ncbi:hypothetical protein LXG23DRAFT_15937 [Yarrowia lipolytica]|uniref:Uncharacterized protein n=1 Tax=Yarrowia lipolytica TaxID=4952 RepID=A0A1D8NIT6_YARLL|nr:hypothetical protein YALI1_E20453g [Yarrowia lipolytica]KAB8282721.1 hypothetical protein BKA91DRAFT_19677 [Yarrowia lipolytica]KAE8173791.1 hypothetical protein BKA90DRAFT_4184 [Yarrowia lipolytica]KAJ8057028.1 hypothetical protein LXG23DRAFT_15937 [Yarrowia lipolytica]RDW27987.1 hypothetical protein B0I71DRAFT_9383 [Yarrowia lipolytica]